MSQSQNIDGWLKLMEKQIATATKDIEELRSEIKRQSLEVREYIMIMADASSFNANLWSSFRFLISAPESINAISFINGMERLMNEEKEFIDRFQDYNDWAISNTRLRLHRMFPYLRNFKIRFMYFADMMVRAFGVDLAKDTVSIQDIADYFGEESTEQWKELEPILTPAPPSPSEPQTNNEGDIEQENALNQSITPVIQSRAS